ncbi:MAG: S8 family peptidase [Candidatus Aenigmatarchaeota archaeon]
MKKLLALLLLTLILPIIASAQSPRSRFIARTNLRFIPILHGCKILHELNDATAVECSEASVEFMRKFVPVEEDQIYHIMDIDADKQIGADKVWEKGYTGSGITVAILDTGVDLNHPALFDSIAGGKSFVSYTSSYQDDNDHGTHVAGIITANSVNEQAKGVAPDALIWAAKVCDSSGSCYSSDIAAAIEYVVNNKIAKVISISLGGGGTTRANCDSDYLAKKVNWAVDHGVTVVAAAGNTGGIVASPACASKAIAVGAVDKNDVRASWSGSGLALDIVAPGVSIYSTLPNNNYASWSGTSMATPHVSAVIALLLQANPALTDSQIKEALYKTAKDLGSVGWDKYYGYGRVDAYAAFNYVLTPPPTTTTTTLPCLPRFSPCTSNEQCCSGYCRGISYKKSICW